MVQRGEMLELEGPILGEGPGALAGQLQELMANNDEDEDEEHQETASPISSLPARPHQLRQLRSRLLMQRNKAKCFKAKSAAVHHHRIKDVQRRGSTIARVWDTLATGRWSHNNNNKSPTPAPSAASQDDEIIARLHGSSVEPQEEGAPPALIGRGNFESSATTRRLSQIISPWSDTVQTLSALDYFILFYFLKTVSKVFFFV